LGHNPFPVDLEMVARERAREDRECSYYGKCLTRAACTSPGLIVPCKGCQGTPVDLDGLKTFILGFEDHHTDDERYGPQVAYGIMPGDDGHCQQIFSFAEMERARAWLKGRDTSKIFVYPPQRTTHNFG